jgi:hypothetical protein
MGAGSILILIRRIEEHDDAHGKKISTVAAVHSRKAN